LRSRASTPPAARAALDARESVHLCRPCAVVFTDTDDFTRRTLEHGIVHFLMAFERCVAQVPASVARHGGRLVKVDGDSLLLEFPDAARACRGVDALERLLARLNRRVPVDERLRFSYGVGFGTLLVVEHDLFGAEVNLAAKLGEDVAGPGEVLLTPAARAGLPDAWQARLRPHGRTRLGGQPIAVARLLPIAGRPGRPNQAVARASS
jgi:class 3 adenylate cyclase